MPAAASLQKRVKSLLASSSGITAEILNSSLPSLDAKLEELCKAAEKCVAFRETMHLPDDYNELDAQGTGLWNLAAGLARDRPDGGGVKLLRVRIAAYYMLEAAMPLIGRKPLNTVRLFKVANKVGKLCLDRKDLQWASKIMERAARFQGELSKSPGVMDDPAVSHVICEYYILRTALAWKQSSLSIADYMFSKATESGQYLAEPRMAERMAERMADVLLDIGSELLRQNSFEAAIKWLQRAFDILCKVDPAYLTEAGAELRLSVTHRLARACIKSAIPGDLDKAKNIIDVMAEDWPSRISVYLLKLDLLVAESPNDAMAYHEIVLKMISVAQLTETTFKTILGKIHALVSKKATVLACACLDSLISTRLLPMEKDDWLEQAFITRLWIIIQDQAHHDEESVIESLCNLLDVMARQLGKPLSLKATHAAQILLWKGSEVLYGRGDFRCAMMWCRVALHMVFDKGGELNHAKISRRIILCSILTKDYGTAAEIFNEMQPAAQEAAYSRFLMFKVALRTSDNDLALSSLVSICENTTADRRLLYACALDAQDIGNRKLALRTLRAILQKIDAFPAESCHVPSLLRCTIRLTMTEIEDMRDSAASVETLCGLFEKVILHATRSRQKARAAGTKDSLFDATELMWFSCNGYNLGLRGIIEWAPPLTLRILTACKGLLDLYPEDTDATTFAEMTYRRILCEFLCASLCIEIARMNDSIEQQLQHYLLTRNFIQSFSVKFKELTGRSQKEIEDLRCRYSTLLGYDFEAATRLKNWEALPRLVEEGVALSVEANSSVSEAMSDLILCSGAPEKVVLTVMNKLLDSMITAKRKELPKLARFLRSLVQLALTNDVGITEELLAQAIELARGANPINPYPAEELQWLIATTWNRSIDFSCASDTSNANQMSSFALSLAGLLEDKSMLKYLQGKMLEASNTEGGGGKY